jgi:hypothetical protein
VAKEVAGLPHLETFTIANNPDLSGSIPVSFPGLTNLNDIRIFDNSLTGPLPEDLGLLSKVS